MQDERLTNPLSPDTVQLDLRDHEVFALLSALVSYALEGQTSLTWTACDLIRKIAPCLDVCDISILLQEIEEKVNLAQRMGATVGNVGDHKNWTKAVEFLSDLIGRRLDEVYNQ